MSVGGYNAGLRTGSGGTNLRPDSARSVQNRSSAPANAEEMILYKRKNPGTNRTPSGASVVRTSTNVPNDAHPTARETIDSNNINLGFESEGSRGSTKAVRGNSLTESRKRIAQAVGRK